MPSQISPPIEYSDGDPINAAAFNGHVKNATLQNGSITEQTDISLSVVPSVDKLDSIVVYDQSEVTTNRLRKTNIESIFTTGAPIVAESIVTPIINASANRDIDITPNAGVIMSNKAYFSADGFNVTVTSTDHLLETGMLVEFTDAVHTGHNGRYQITVLTSDTFTYRNGLATATTAGSGTLTYKKAATVYIIGSEVINDDLRVAGDVAIGGKADIAGHVNVGSLKISGKTPLTKEDSFLNIETRTVSLPVGTAWGAVDYNTYSFNVPPGETWTFVWATNTVAWFDSGNTRVEVAYYWDIYTNTGTMIDTMAVAANVRGALSMCGPRSFTVKNEGTTGNTHTIKTLTGTYVISGTLNVLWKTRPGRHKWSEGTTQLTLYKQKTNTMAGESGSGVPITL